MALTKEEYDRFREIYRGYREQGWSRLGQALMNALWEVNTSEYERVIASPNANCFYLDSNIGEFFTVLFTKVDPVKPTHRIMAFRHCDGNRIDPLAPPNDPRWLCQGCFSCMPPTETECLNQIDDPYPCNVTIWETSQHTPILCGSDEHDPFSRKCYDHSYGGLYYTKET